MSAIRSPVTVGREADATALRGYLHSTAARSGGVVLVLGAAGVGKSRLVSDLAETARHDGWLVVSGRATAADEPTAFGPLREALLELSRERNWRDLPGVGRWRGLLEVLLEPADETRVAFAATDEGGVFHGEAVRSVLHGAAADRALLVVLEDLHWADDDTVRVVDYLSDNLADARVLCVVTARSGAESDGSGLVDGLTRHRGVGVIGLSPLTDDDVRSMAHACQPGLDDSRVEYLVSVSEGVPLLVEDLLSSEGLPPSFRASVVSRLATLPPQQRAVVEDAALLGTVFDWTLLLRVHPDAEVAAALESAAAQQLIDPTGAGYRFHHSLTREAVVESLMPHLRSRRASALFTAATRGGPPTDDRLAMAIDLAVGAGRDEEAADLLIVAGHRLVRQGALGSAIDILGRAVRLTSRRETRQLALGRRIEVLAEAGRVDEALADGERLMAEPNTPAQELVRAHLALARAAAQASRWTSLAERLAVVDPLVDVDGPSRERQQVRVLAAELALARRDLEGAVDLADTVLAQVDGDADVRCAALSVRGRAHRSQDLEAAHHDFEEVLAVAEATGLSTWRLRALHELGTIDLFDHAGTARLRQAQALAAEVGASGLTIVLDVQLAAAHLFAFDLAGVEEHAMVAAVSAKRLHLHQLQATALAFLAESAGLRGALDEMETCAVRARSAVPGDREIEGSILGGRGVALLLLDRRDAAREALNQAASLLDPLPNAGPGLYRGLLPLLLTVERDPAAPAAARAARAAGVTVNRGNEGLLKLAEAVELARQPGRRTDPVTLVDEAMRSLAAFPGWAQLGLVLTAEAALADSWGDPAGWIDRALLELTTSGMTALAERCRVLAATGPLKGRPEVTPREQEVWTLLAEGLTNKQIASRLTLSPRTIEKHVENLLRKTGTRTRTELARAPGLDLRTPRDT